MSLSTASGEECGNSCAPRNVALIRIREARQNIGMSILFRLIAIAVRKYTTQPNDRAPAVRMMLRNVVRLAVAHLGREQASSIALEALQEPTR